MESDLKEKGGSQHWVVEWAGEVKNQTHTASVAESQKDRHKYVQQQSRERDDVYGRGPLLRTAGSNLDCVHRVSYIHALEKNDLEDKFHVRRFFTH